MIERTGEGSLVKQAIAATGYMFQSILGKKLTYLYLSILLLERQVSAHESCAFLE